MNRLPGWMVAMVMTGSLCAAGSWNAAYGAGDSQQSSVVKVVNKDQFEGKWKQFKGELKKKWGNFTDDDMLYIEGSMEKFDGKAQERYGDRKEEVKRWTDDWFKEQERRNN
jgi:uncharacterized protein YjbJ (UPF0337 family)